MKDIEKIYCPVNGWDCPYWRKEDGSCSMLEDEKIHPKDECEDYEIFNEIFGDL